MSDDFYKVVLTFVEGNDEALFLETKRFRKPHAEAVPFHFQRAGEKSSVIYWLVPDE